MEKLVNEKKMVILYPELATKIGLNEAIMLQHIHFWLQESKHHKDGRVWCITRIKPGRSNCHFGQPKRLSE